MAWNDSNTVLLINSNTTDASTTFTDTSTGGTTHTITAVNDTQHKTTQKKFGTTSIYFDGTGDALTAPDSANWDFGSGDFTIDFWVYCAQAIGVYNEEFIMYYNGASKLSWFTRRNTDGTLNIFLSSNGTSWDFNQATSETITSDAWHHIAIVRTSNVIKPFIDGTLATLSSTAYSNTISTASDLLRICDSGPGSDVFEGYLDEIRISKGVARWTANFTPPATLFGNDAAHAHTIDQPSVVLILAILTANDSTHAHSPDQPSLLAIYELTVADSTHAHTTDTFLLIVIIEPADSTHAHSADAITSVVFFPIGEVIISFTGQSPSIEWTGTSPDIGLTGQIPSIEWTGTVPEIEFLAQSPSIAFSFDA